MTTISPFYELKIKDLQRLKSCSATTATKIRKRIINTLAQKGYDNAQSITIFRYAHIEGASINEVIKAIQ